MAITDDYYYQREIIPDELHGFFYDLCDHFNSNPGSGGIRGNTAHTTGRHRSLEFCKYSPYSTNHNYGTQDKRDTDGNHRHIRAVDLALGASNMSKVSHRLDDAVRAGDAPMVAEWFGTFNGEDVVGWYEGHPEDSDDSHLTHVHVGVWTKYADDRDALNELYAIMTGETMALSDDDIDRIVNALLSKKLKVTEGWLPVFPADPGVQDGTISFETALKSGYFWTRQAEDPESAPTGSRMGQLEAKVDQVLEALAGGTPLPPPGGATSGTGTFTWTTDPSDAPQA